MRTSARPCASAPPSPAAASCRTALAAPSSAGRGRAAAALGSASSSTVGLRVVQRAPVHRHTARSATHVYATSTFPDGESRLFDSEASFRNVEYVQWYPGHIARAERQLKASLKLVDVVIEVRDARIPLATTHPQIPEWIQGRQHVIVLNREDCVRAEERKQWEDWYEQRGQKIFFTDARLGKGIPRVAKEATAISRQINAKRKARGLNPRAVRVAVVGFPNVGKSALINRLSGRAICQSASRPGVTRQLKWVRVADNIDLLDSPGVLPPSLRDQAAAARLAMCDDIGEAAYTTSLVASAMLLRFQFMQGAGASAARRTIQERYDMDISKTTPEAFLETVADTMFKGDKEVAGHRLLQDYRKGRLGSVALEVPPAEDSVKPDNGGYAPR